MSTKPIEIKVDVPGVADRCYFDPRLETWGATKLAPHRGRTRTRGRGYSVEYHVPEDVAREVLPDLRNVWECLSADADNRADARALHPIIERLAGALSFIDGIDR